MGSRLSPLALAFTALLAGGTSCRPLLDGGWEGIARCNGDAFPLTGVFNENADGELDGLVYIEGFVFGFIAKGVIEDGARDARDGSYSFDLETDDDEPPDFTVDMEYTDDTFEELDGTVDVLDGNGEVTDSCAMSMDKVSVAD